MYIKYKNLDEFFDIYFNCIIFILLKAGNAINFSNEFSLEKEIEFSK